MRFTIHTGLKITPFELYHCRKPRTEFTNVIRTGSFLFNRSEMFISAKNRPKIPIYLFRKGDRELSNHIVMASTKMEEKALAENSPKKRSSVSNYPFQFSEKTNNKKPLEGRFQKNLQMAVKGTEHTETTDTGKINHRKFVSGPIIF